MNTTQKNQEEEKDVCKKCGSPLTDVITTPSGKRLQRCSKGTYNSETRKIEGCSYVKWLAPEQEELDEKCPKCGSPLILTQTRYGKKMKKCSTGGWDAKAKKPTGCDYIEWITGKAVELNEDCPECGKPLVLYTTAKGKKMKKCSTGGWDAKAKKPTGCTYVEWLNDYVDTGEEYLPPEEE